MITRSLGQEAAADPRGGCMGAEPPAPTAEQPALLAASPGRTRGFSVNVLENKHISL